jgi:hypothetical protein
MYPIHVEACNVTFKGTDGDGIEALPVMASRYEDGSVSLTSFWLPSPEELEGLNKGQPLMVSILDTKHPPIKLEIANVELVKDAAPNE